MGRKWASVWASQWPRNDDTQRGQRQRRARPERMRDSSCLVNSTKQGDACLSCDAATSDRRHVRDANDSPRELLWPPFDKLLKEKSDGRVYFSARTRWWSCFKQWIFIFPFWFFLFYSPDRERCFFFFNEIKWIKFIKRKIVGEAIFRWLDIARLFCWEMNFIRSRVKHSFLTRNREIRKSRAY